MSCQCAPCIVPSLAFLSAQPALMARHSHANKGNKRSMRAEEERGKKKRENPPSDADANTSRSEDDDRAGSSRVGIIAVPLIVILVLLFKFLEEAWAGPNFIMAVPFIEGLSPASQPPAAPVFTLALHMDNSHNFFYRPCYTRGETRVFYQSVQIAAAPIEAFCIDRSSKKDMTIRAWSMELQLPVFLHDQLYEETMKNTAVFDVQLRLDEAYDSLRPNSDDTFIINCHAAVGNAAMTGCQVSVQMRLLTNADHCVIPMRAMMLPCSAPAAAPAAGIARNELEIMQKGVMTGEMKAAV